MKVLFTEKTLKYLFFTEVIDKLFASRQKCKDKKNAVMQLLVKLSMK